MQFARINNVTIHYRSIGLSTGRPVLVFANSLGTDFRIWDSLCARLGDRFGLLLYDKRGHGLSDTGALPCSMEDHADDLAGLMDGLSVHNAIICGLSVGGLVAQSLVQRRPDLVRALILCNTAHKIGTAQTWNARIDAVLKDGIAPLVDGIMERWFTPAYRQPDNIAYAGYRTMLARQEAQAYAATCAAIRDTDYTEAAGRITVPTLCIVGDQDGSTPPDLVRSMAELIPGACFEVIADAGHIPCVEQPEALAALIEGFVAEILQGEQPRD